MKFPTRTRMDWMPEPLVPLVAPAPDAPLNAENDAASMNEIGNHPKNWPKHHQPLYCEHEGPAGP